MFLRVALTAAAAIATTAIGLASPANAQPLQPGPHSALADVDLPEGTVPCTTSGCIGNTGASFSDEEWWRYSVPYDDLVAFLRERFATGRRYDTHGATWWNSLPPCYDTDHQSPPWGKTLNDGTGTDWIWNDGATKLYVSVDKPGIKTAGGDIVPVGRILIGKFLISNPSDPGGNPCYRA
jgi:hypothetical protein